MTTPEEEIIDRYHIYQRTNGVYYCWYMENGQRVYKSLKCKTKSAARLAVKKIAIVEIQSQSPTFAEYSRDFFLRGRCKWLSRWESRHAPLKENTLTMYRRILDLYLLPEFGPDHIESLDGADAEDRVMAMVSDVTKELISNTYRNEVLRILAIIMDEAIRDKLRSSVFRVEKLTRNTTPKDCLTDEELEKLFPLDQDRLEWIWRSGYHHEPKNAGRCFGTLYALMVSTGIRSGEARALQPEHIFPEYSSLIVVQQFDRQEEISLPKKGREKNPKYRAALIPDRTMGMLKTWMDENQEGEYLFEYIGRPIQARMIGQRFEKGLERAGIVLAGRTLTPHCLRYTYNTRMETVLPGQVLRAMIGHGDERMTQLYSRPIMVERVKQIQEHRSLINQFWA